MSLKIWHLAFVLFLMMAFSCAASGLDNLLISGIWQDEGSQATNLEYAERLNAKFVPTYYSEGTIGKATGKVLDIGAVERATPWYFYSLTGERFWPRYDRNERNGLTNILLNGNDDNYETIYAHSGGARTAVTAMLYQGVTAKKLVLIDPARGDQLPADYNYEIQKLLDMGINIDFYYYDNEKFLEQPFAGLLWRGIVQVDDFQQGGSRGTIRVIPISSKMLGGLTGNAAHIQMWNYVLNLAVKEKEENPNSAALDAMDIRFTPLLPPPNFDTPSEEGPSGSDISDIGSLTPEQMDALIEQMQALGQTIEKYLDYQVTVSIWVHYRPNDGGPARGTTITIIDGAGNEIPVELDSNGKAIVSGAPGTWTITASSTGWFDAATWSEVVSSGSAYADLYQKFNPPIWHETGAAGVGPLV